MRRLFMTTGPGRKSPSGAAALAGMLAVGATALSGCISDPFSHPTDASSPAAARVNAIANADLPYPKWSHFPAAPKDVPTPAQFAARAQDISASQTQLLREAAGLQWTLSGTEDWAAAGRATIDPRLAVPAPPTAEADMEAWAALQRAKAVPPPRVK